MSTDLIRSDTPYHKEAQPRNKAKYPTSEDQKIILDDVYLMLKELLKISEEHLRNFNETNTKLCAAKPPGINIMGRNSSLHRPPITNTDRTSKHPVHDGTLQKVPEGRWPSSGQTSMNDALFNMKGTQDVCFDSKNSSIATYSIKTASLKESGHINCNSTNGAPRYAPSGDPGQHGHPRQQGMPSKVKPAVDPAAQHEDAKKKNTEDSEEKVCDTNVDDHNKTNQTTASSEKRKKVKPHL